MYKFSKIFAPLFVSCAVFSGGCDTAIAPEVAHSAPIADDGMRFDKLGALGLPGQENVVIDDLQMSLAEEAVTVRMGQLEDGSFGVLEGAGGRAVAPGVWEVETADGLVQQIIVGDEGQQWLIAEMTGQLDELRGRLGREADEDTLLEQIAAMEEAIATAKSSVTDLAVPSGVLAPSCNISLYAGPSGPVWGVPGATAFAQSSCSGGCATITVRSQACCNGACTPLSIASNTVCSPLWTSGMLRQGSGSGWAQVSVNPVAVTNQGFACY